MICWLAGEAGSLPPAGAVRYARVRASLPAPATASAPPGTPSRQGSPVVCWAVYEAGKTGYQRVPTRRIGPHFLQAPFAEPGAEVLLAALAAQLALTVRRRPGTPRNLARRARRRLDRGDRILRLVRCCDRAARPGSGTAGLSRCPPDEAEFAAGAGQFRRQADLHGPAVLDPCGDASGDNGMRPAMPGLVARAEAGPRHRGQHLLLVVDRTAFVCSHI
jgi:hypothetical protein